MRSPLLLLLAVALLSGCVAQESAFVGSGLVIEEFSTDFPSIYPGEEVHLNLKLANRGAADAKITEMELTGLDLKSWKEKSNTCRELYRAPIPAGGSANCAIALVSPDTGNLEISYSPKIHVTYSYRSNSVALVTVGTVDELRRITLRGGALPYEARSSAGPVAIDIKASSPVKASGTSVEFPVRFTVTNGGGTACSGACGPATWNKIRVSLETSFKVADCPSQIELVLYRGQSNAFVCNLKASAPDAGAGLVQKSIEARSDYGYIIQAETVVAVRKRAI